MVAALDLGRSKTPGFRVEDYLGFSASLLRFGGLMGFMSLYGLRGFLVLFFKGSRAF